MLLAIDVGNTNTLFALVRDGVIQHRWRISTKNARTADEYMVWVSQLMGLEGCAIDDVHSAIIATVVPDTLFNLQLLCRRYFGVTAMVVTNKLDLGIGIDLPNPAEVGADRLVNAVAAHAEHPGNLIIIDFGTATTFDVLTGDGVYRGGIIAPGINLSIDALFMASAKLPNVAVEPPSTGRAIGRSTVEAMQSGIFFGYLGLIEGMVVRCKAEIDGPAKVIATGGLGVLFDRHTPALDLVDVDLTVKGLALIHARNSD